jgi:molybdate transport system permease protein
MDAALVPLLLTLKVAGWATLAATVLGALAALWIARSRHPAREIVDATFTLPMVLPPTVLGYYLLVVLGRQGPFGAWLEREFGINLIFTWPAAAIAATIVAFPLVFKSARAALEAIDPNLEKAGRALGYDEVTLLLRVSLPLAWRGILAGAMLAFARAMGEFGATLMVAGSIPGRTQTMSIAIYEAVQAGDDPLATRLVLITSIACIVILVVAGAQLRSGYMRVHPA